jgi:hypothetical protein
MPLAPSTRLGPYEILSPLGAGGMGEVYRARDPRMGREVAIKLSAERFSDRFEREVHAVAALNHPNICQIHDVGPNYLVMELVEGPTLADRIKQGAIPLEEALPIARQVADALEAAHEKGIIHRDLKPANIKITPDGVVKVLDFGLAKMVEPAAAAGSPDESPTVAMGATRVGQIMGTAAYMAPEQARGKVVDKRADIWAFGVVLYEMLTGQALFASGDTLPDTIAAVMTREPDWNALPKDTPPHVRRLLRRCLCKDARNRLRDIGDARIALEEGCDTTPEGASRTPPNRLRRALPWAMAAAAAIIAAWTVGHRGEGARREVMHLDISYPPNVEPIAWLQGGFAISPDGRSIAMLGVRDGVRRLYVRQLERAEPVEINDSAGMQAVDFSPDGTSIVLSLPNGSLTLLSLADRRRAILTSGTGILAGITWGPGEIIYTRDATLWTVPTKGGAPRQLTVLDPGRHEVLHTDAAVFPGTRTVLFSSLSTEAGAERIEAVSLDGGRRSVVIEHALATAWSPTGHLLFGRDGAGSALRSRKRDRARRRGPRHTGRGGGHQSLGRPRIPGILHRHFGIRARRLRLQASCLRRPRRIGAGPQPAAKSLRKPADFARWTPASDRDQLECH